MDPISSAEALDLLLDDGPMTMYWNWPSVLLLICLLSIFAWGFWQDWKAWKRR